MGNLKSNISQHGSPSVHWEGWDVDAYREGKLDTNLHMWEQSWSMWQTYTGDDD